MFSHWLLDFFAHRPDLPVYGNSMKIGLGLWDYPTIAVVVEVGIFISGAIWYAISVHGFNRKATWLFWVFVLISVVSSSVRGAAMAITSPNKVAVAALLFYIIYVFPIYSVQNNASSKLLFHNMT